MATRRAFNIVVLLISACVTGCGTDAKESSDGKSVYIPPSMRPRATTQADAEPPNVPLSTSTPRADLRVVASWPHDTVAYTQGLLVYRGRLLESTGLETHSDVREVDRRSGEVRRRTPLAPSRFGEGIAVVGARVYQLTWLTGIAYVYDVATLTRIDSVHYDGEGWGLTTDGARLFMSDGSSRLRIIDPAGFRTIRLLPVTEADQPVWMLNELEYVRGEIWANIYRTDLIARIDAHTGHIIGWLDVSTLLTPAERRSVEARGGVANGIAFDSTRNTLLLTGKLWPRLFEVTVPHSPPTNRSAITSAATDLPNWSRRTKATTRQPLR
jgi:glutamine cyclotransferase